MATVTFSVKATRTVIRSPSVYVLVAFGDDTFATAGAVMIAILLEFPSEPYSPGAGRVRFAAFPAMSVMIPAKAFVAL